MVHQDILRVGLAAQSLGLLGENIKAAKLSLKKGNDKKALKRIVKTGVINLVGIPLLTTQAQLIGSA